MIPYFHFDKIIIGPIVFYTWGIFLVLAILLVYICVLRRVSYSKLYTEQVPAPKFLVREQGQKQVVAPDFFHDLFFWVILGIIAGGRLGYVLQFPQKYFFDPLSILKIWEGGLAFYGGLFGGIIFALIFLKLKKKDSSVIWRIIDSVFLFLPLGIAVGRIGCFLINDHQGRETSLFLGILWPDGTIRHPMSLYYIISALILFLILNVLKNKLSKPGQLFFAFLFLYPLFSFFLDFTRDDPLFWGLGLNQWISLAIFFAAMIITVRRQSLSAIVKL